MGCSFLMFSLRLRTINIKTPIALVRGSIEVKTTGASINVGSSMSALNILIAVVRMFEIAIWRWTVDTAAAGSENSYGGCWCLS